MPASDREVLLHIAERISDMRGRQAANDSWIDIEDEIRHHLGIPLAARADAARRFESRLPE